LSTGILSAIISLNIHRKSSGGMHEIILQSVYKQTQWIFGGTGWIVHRRFFEKLSYLGLIE